MNETGYWSKKYAAFNCIDDDGSSVNFYRKIYSTLDPDYQLNNIQDIYVLRFADVLLTPSEDGYFMYVFYVSNTHNTFAGLQTDCIKK